MNDNSMTAAHAELDKAAATTPQADIDLCTDSLREIVRDADYADRQVRLNAISMLYQMQVQQRLADQQRADAAAAKPASH